MARRFHWAFDGARGLVGLRKKDDKRRTVVGDDIRPAAE
jgi:hypothetical protein